jgi:hypothetical protein
METSNTDPSLPAGAAPGGRTAAPRSSSSVARAAAVAADAKTARILARSIFRDMQSYGISNDKILEVASELIALVTHQLKEDGEGEAHA